MRKNFKFISCLIIVLFLCLPFFNVVNSFAEDLVSEDEKNVSDKINPDTEEVKENLETSDVETPDDESEAVTEEIKITFEALGNNISTDYEGIGGEAYVTIPGNELRLLSSNRSKTRNYPAGIKIKDIEEIGWSFNKEFIGWSDQRGGKPLEPETVLDKDITLYPYFRGLRPSVVARTVENFQVGSDYSENSYTPSEHARFTNGENVFDITLPDHIPSDMYEISPFVKEGRKNYQIPEFTLDEGWRATAIHLVAHSIYTDRHTSSWRHKYRTRTIKLEDSKIPDKYSHTDFSLTQAEILVEVERIPLDTSYLAEVVASAQAIDQTKYTDLSVKEFVKVLEAAEKVLTDAKSENPTVLQKDIDQVAVELELAMSALELRTSDPSGTYPSITTKPTTVATTTVAPVKPTMTDTTVLNTTVSTTSVAPTTVETTILDVTETTTETTLASSTTTTTSSSQAVVTNTTTAATNKGKDLPKTGETTSFWLPAGLLVLLIGAVVVRKQTQE